jgi:hypothetical protein
MMAEKTGLVEPVEAAVARQRLGRHVSAVTNQHTAVEELLESVFYAVHAKAIKGHLEK